MHTLADSRRMRTRAATLLLIAGVSATPLTGVIEPAGASAAPAAASKCSLAYVGGKKKCLAGGQACKRRYEKDYEPVGYTCVKRRGKYRLKSRAGYSF